MKIKEEILAKIDAINVKAAADILSIQTKANEQVAVLQSYLDSPSPWPAALNLETGTLKQKIQLLLETLNAKL